MRKSLVLVVLTLAAFGCSKDRAAESSTDTDTGTDQAPVAQAPAEQEETKEPTEAEAREERVRQALAEQGVAAVSTETLPTRLGNLEACAPTERRRYNLPGELVYVIVGTYPTEEAAKGCISAYEAFLGDKWAQYENDFYRQSRFVLELNPKMTDEEKSKARKAVEGSLE